MARLWPVALLVPVSVSCALATEQDLSSPIRNLRMDARTKRLTWAIEGNVTRIECRINSSPHPKVKNNTYCQFHILPKCTVWNYTVHVTLSDGKSFSTWIQYPRQEGNPAAAAGHLQCRVHDVDNLTCSWAVGREAPKDVQYSLYLEDPITGRTWQCPHYSGQELGTVTQCQFRDLAEFADTEHPYRFVVNGTSKQAKIPCSEFIEYLPEIEILMKPKLTVKCNKSLAVLEWEMSSHFTRIIDYELEIRKGEDPPFTEKVHLEKSWTLNNPGTFTAAIRALRGQWSAPQRFVCDPEDTQLHRWLTSLLIAVVTLLAVGAAVLLCKKYSLMRKLFPPIPQIKDHIPDDFEIEKMTAVEAGKALQEDCPVAEVQAARDT